MRMLTNRGLWRGRSARRVIGALLLGAVLSATGALSQAVAAPDAEPAAAKPVDLNTATEQELQTLPGIGPALAKRIVEFRQENGEFSRVEDLLKVKGIGEKSFEKLKSRLTVGKRRS